MFISKAYWSEPDRGDYVTTDKHASYDEAAAVCKRLRMEGLGGEGKVYPLKTEVYWDNKNIGK